MVFAIHGNCTINHDNGVHESHIYMKFEPIFMFLIFSTHKIVKRVFLIRHLCKKSSHQFLSASNDRVITTFSSVYNDWNKSSFFSVTII